MSFSFNDFSLLLTYAIKDVGHFNKNKEKY